MSLPWLIKYSGRSPVLNGGTDDLSLSFTTPACDDAYDFAVNVRLTWSPAGRRRQGRPEPSEWEYVAGLVRDLIRTEARSHSPFEPGAAETAVNSALTRLFARIAHQGQVRAIWSGRAEFDAVEEVRMLQQERSKALYQLETEAATAHQQTAYTREVRLAWENFLAEATKSWYARYAAQLTERPEAVADVLAAMLDDREKTATHFLRNLDAMASAHERSNVFDMVVRSDRALRHVMQVLGLTVPPLDPDPLLEPLVASAAGSEG
ncbi:hypothetical protein [Microtetraspora niveoalba]|uniref:hypothetical protein n=1 Tax=Microtetraspora niveoalba TaxID=46175 RepID=UPI0008377952|nr:hypothetical protein [Microtetraspora niveoalba]